MARSIVRMMQADARERISRATVRGSRTRVKWSEADIARIQEAFKRAGHDGAVSAFPERSESSVNAAIIRYCRVDPPSIAASQPSGSVWDDSSFNRRFDAVLAEVFAADSDRTACYIPPAFRRDVARAR